jgi:hypothetical protein
MTRHLQIAEEQVEEMLKHPVGGKTLSSVAQSGKSPAKST